MYMFTWDSGGRCGAASPRRPAGGSDVRILIADDHTLFRDGLRLVLAELGPDVEVVEASTYDDTLAMVADEPIDLVLLDLVMPGLPWTDGLRALIRAAPSVPVVVLSASDDRRLILEAVRLGARGFIPKTLSGRLMLSALRLVLSGGVYLPPTVVQPNDGAQRSGRPTADPLISVDAEGAESAETDPRGPHRPGDRSAIQPGTDSGTRIPLVDPADVPLTPRQRDVLCLLGEGKSNKEIARVLGLSEGTVKLHVTAILKALNVTNRTGAVVAASRLGLTRA